MFLRRKSKQVRGVGYSYWNLCETYRTARGPRRRVAASLGKLDELLAGLLPAGRESVSWSQVAALLTVARFCAQRSELGVAEHWYDTMLPGKRDKRNGNGMCFTRTGHRFESCSVHHIYRQ